MRGIHRSLEVIGNPFKSLWDIRIFFQIVEAFGGVLSGRVAGGERVFFECRHRKKPRWPAIAGGSCHYRRQQD